MDSKYYIAIDLKSFYASVECVERGLDPLEVNLVVADESRTEKTICLAVSPSLKKYGIPGRARLFEVNQKVREINGLRKLNSQGQIQEGESFYARELDENPRLKLSFITAPPRMKLYMDYSTRIYDIYLEYIAPEDIHIYSIDEVFIDATPYLKIYDCTPRELAMKLINRVFSETGITATAGVGTNLYLCKIAMDIVAKKCEPDENGVRIAELDEMSYRRELWEHRPLTDFWRIGRGYSKKLEEYGLYTMGDIARCSCGKPDEFYNEALLYRLFGVNAELLIDHTWGWEPCTMEEIKSYRPQSNSISSGQVLGTPYGFSKARLIIREMAELLALDLVQKRLSTNQLVLTVGYDVSSLKGSETRYSGEIKTDFYGRKVPKNSHGTVSLPNSTSSSKIIVNGFMDLFDRIVAPNLFVKRVCLAAGRVFAQGREEEPQFEQLDFFTDYEKRDAERQALRKERQLQLAILKMEQKYGKNAVLKGMNLLEGATTIERNSQVGGHKA